MTNLLDAQTEVHVQLGNGAPAFIPTAIGQHYIDIANKRVYQSTGVNNVEDWGDALATLDDLAKLDFTVTKADVGLDKVENYGVASKAEAEGGEINDAYMTPLRVTELLNALYKPTLDAFMARTDNPHQVTAAQVGALTAAATEALLAEKLNSGDLAGLLQVFWSEKVGGAPETLDTIDEIAAALQNNPEVIEALQALVEGNRLTIVEAMDAIAALQALVGESTAFLTAESDLGVNPVALTGDEGAARDLKAILEGMVAKDAAQDQALTDARDALQTQIGTKADKVATEAALGGLQTAVEGLGTQISDNEQAATDAIQAVQDAVVTEKGEREAADLVLDQKVDAAVLALEENKVGRTDNIDTNTVTEGEGEEAVQVALSTLIAQLKAGIAQAGDASALDALQQAFNAFVAAKASSAEVLEGLDNAKYTTSVGVKAAIDTAIAALVDGAPEALDTINELAAALQNNPDVITALQTLVSENASALGLVAGRVTAIEAELPNKVDQGGDITDNTVVVSDSAVALGELITQLQSAIALAGDASALEALQQAFNAFVAAKATAEEAITGTDDEKYLTSVSAKAAIAAAVAELVGTAPEALDTINELAAALNNDPDIINTLMTQVGGKETPEGAQAKVDAALAIARAEIAALTTVVDTKVDKGGNIDTNTLTVGEGEEAAQVALSDVLVQLEAAFSGKMEDAATNLEALQAALDTFIAAKATGAEAIAGEDDAKYITALALKAALDALDLSGKLDVDAQAADSAKLEGKTLAEIITQIMGGEGSEGLTLTSLQDALDALSGRVTATESDKLDATAQAVDSALLEGKTLSEIVASIVGGGSGPLAVKIDCGAGWTNSSNIQLNKLSFFKSTEPETVFTVDLSLITSELGNLYYNNGFLDLSSLNYEQSITITNFGAVPEGVDRMVIELEQLYETTGVISVIDNESPEVVYGTFNFDATLGQSVDNEYSDTFEVSFDRPAAEPVVGLTLAGLNSDLDALEGRVSDVELNKLDADAQAVDSALLEGRSVADLTASDVEATSGVVTDKFMTPSTSKAAFDARWAEKVGTAPETLDTIEELAAALRNTPDALAALEAMAKEYTDTEVLAAITQLSGVDMPAGTTLASVMLAITALQTGKLDSAAQAVDSAKLEGKTLAEIITQIVGGEGSEGLTLNSLDARLTVTEEAVETLGTSKLDATAQAVDSAKLGGKSLSEVIDSAIQPGRLFYPVVHVNGNVDQPDYVMPTPAEVWAQVKTNAVLEQVDTVYAIGVRRLHPGNLLALTGQEGITLVGAVSQAQEGPTYVVMRANVEASVWEVVNEPMLGCLARLSKHCVVVGENTERFVPGQTLFYNGFEALSEGVYYDWTVLADKEWEVVPTTDSELLIDSARYHRTEIRIQSVGPVVINVDVEADLPFEMELRVVNMTGVSVTFAGANITSSPRMEEYAMTKVNGVVRVVRHTNTAVSVAGDLDEAFFANPEYVEPV